MSTGSEPVLERGARRRKDLLCAAHGGLVVVFGLGRLVAALQEAGVDRGAGFASTVLGRSIALVAMVLGLAALAAVVWLTFLERRDAKSLLLFAILLLALWKRDGFDPPDLLYLLAAAAAIAHRIARGRRGQGSRELRG